MMISQHSQGGCSYERAGREVDIMARISYVEKDQTPPEVEQNFARFEKALGRVPNFFKAMAHAPVLLQKFMELDAAMRSTKLDRKLRELAYLKASQVNGCEYCFKAHAGLGLRGGLTEDQIAQLPSYKTSPAYDDTQRLVIEYAEEVTKHVCAPEALMNRLKEHFSEQELVELNLTVGIAQITNRFNESFKVDLDL
jgi:uncharacterized peroxidase-related enzyme